MLKNGQFSILCRISLSGQMCVFSTQLTIDAKRWSASRNRASGRSEKARQTNAILDRIHYSLYNIYLDLLHSTDDVTPHLIRQYYFGIDDCTEGLLQFFKQHNEEFKQRVGITRNDNTLNKYRYVCNHLKQFIVERYNLSDIPLRNVDRSFIYDFHRWLADIRKCHINTIQVYMTAFKHIMSLAVEADYLDKNPFMGYKLHCEPSHRNFLLKEELQRLIQFQTKSQSERLIIDAFLFSCFTGLSYIDVANLRMSNISTSGNKHHISTIRTKTRTTVEVPLLDLPYKLVVRYRNKDETLPIFRLPSNCRCNVVIRRVMERIGIEKRITFHSARHTFATTVTLAHGIPIESVSQMLGHTDIKTTQIYAKVLQTVVNAEMNKASKNINLDFGHN